MNWKIKTLLGLQVFNGLTAVVGGLALMSVRGGGGTWSGVSLEHTGFSNDYFPGVILLAIVGGSALIAAVALVKHVAGWRLTSLVAGMIMIVWIVGEVASVRDFHFFQVIYLVTGVLAVWLTPGGVAPEERERSITT